MKLAYKTLAIAAAFAMAGAAQAAPLTITAGGPAVTSGAWEFSELTGSGTLDFSATLLGALEVAGIVVTEVAPATVSTVTTEEGTEISATAPIATLDIDVGGTTFTANKVGTSGGALLTAPKKNFATTKGSLSITGITVDLTSKAIFADVVGANGVGTVNDLHVWNYANITGATTFPLAKGTSTSANTLTGLTITDAAFDVFALSLGLTNGGKAAMREIDTYGTMTANLSVTVVPEPSSYALVIAGLAAVGFAAKRARRAA